MVSKPCARCGDTGYLAGEHQQPCPDCAARDYARIHQMLPRVVIGVRPQAQVADAALPQEIDVDRATEAVLTAARAWGDADALHRLLTRKLHGWPGYGSEWLPVVDARNVADDARHAALVRLRDALAAYDQALAAYRRHDDTTTEGEAVCAVCGGAQTVRSRYTLPGGRVIEQDEPCGDCGQSDTTTEG